MKIMILRILAIVILTVWFSCNTDEMDSNVGEGHPVTTLFSIKVPNNYYIKNDFYDYHGHVFLTTDEGDIIAESALENNSDVTLEAPFDLDNESYHLTMVKRDRNSAQLFIHTFLNIQPYTIILTDYNYNSVDQKNATVNLLNSKDTEIMEHYPKYATRIEREFDLGGEYAIKRFLGTAIEDLYVVFLDSVLDEWKYLYKKSIMADSTYNVEYSEVPTISQFKNITYPDTRTLNSLLYGLPEDGSNFSIPLFQVTDTTGPTNVHHPIPVDLFDSYQIISNLQTEEYHYYTRQNTDESDMQFQFPELNYEVIDSDLEGFSVTSNNSNGELFTRIIVINNAGNYTYDWWISESSDSKLEFTLPIKIMSFLTNTNVNTDEITYAIVGKQIVANVQTTKDNIYHYLDRHPGRYIYRPEIEFKSSVVFY